MEPLAEAIVRHAQHFGPTLAHEAFARGLAVTSVDGERRAIPVTATPVIRPRQELRRRAALASLLSSATFKMSRAILASSNRELLLGALSPLERAMAQATYSRVTQLATTRVDFFERGGQPFALEVSATIPAMQGYSDIAAHVFLEVVGKYVGMTERQIGQLKSRNGSNAQALYRALLDGFARERGGRAPNRIALLCRRNGAQLTEQLYLCDRFAEFGTPSEVVFPDDVSVDTHFRARGRTFDLVYRHLFVRRLEESPAEAVAELLAVVPSSKAVVLNPPASQVEVKTSFALLSQALSEPELARAAELTEEELAAIRSAVPWTRPFRPGPGIDPDGVHVDDLVQRVAQEPRRFVLKRAWDYGGRAVFVGRSAGEPSFEERVQRAYGEKLDWPALCARTAHDAVGGGFVVQQVVETQAEPHLICSPEGVTAAELYVDFSSYGSVGLDHLPSWGGVCRGSVSQIVNIVGGGGVLPLITAEVAETLAKAFARSQLRDGAAPLSGG